MGTWTAFTSQNFTLLNYRSSESAEWSLQLYPVTPQSPTAAGSMTSLPTTTSTSSPIPSLLTPTVTSPPCTVCLILMRRMLLVFLWPPELSLLLVLTRGWSCPSFILPQLEETLMKFWESLIPCNWLPLKR